MPDQVAESAKSNAPDLMEIHDNALDAYDKGQQDVVIQGLAQDKRLSDGFVAMNAVSNLPLSATTLEVLADERSEIAGFVEKYNQLIGLQQTGRMVEPGIKTVDYFSSYEFTPTNDCDDCPNSGIVSFDDHIEIIFLDDDIPTGFWGWITGCRDGVSNNYDCGIVEKSRDEEGFNVRTCNEKKTFVCWHM